MALRTPKNRFLPYAVAIVVPAAGTLVVLPLRSHIDLSNIGLLYVLSIVLTATRFGRSPAILTALLGAVFFIGVFSPGGLLQAFAQGQNILAAIIMLAVALVVGHITSRLTRHAEFAETKSLQSRTLYEFSQKLSGAQTSAAVVDTTCQFFADSLGAARVQVIFPGDFATPPPPASPDLIESCIGGQTPCLVPSGTGSLHALLPLRATSGIQGVLGFETESGFFDRPDGSEYIETIASVVSVALERSRFAEIARESEIKHTSERLRSSILSALSHDLRTPLAALVSMADTAALGKASQERQKHLLEAIRNQALSINHQMMNLLEMAKLSSGSVELKPAWQPVDEVLGSVLKLIRTQWKDREISVDLAPNLPAICIDAVLIERVLWNLLENAIKYSPADTMIELAVQQVQDQLEISVTDSGSGLPDADIARLFQIFQRGKAESDIAGVGLGLAISRTIVEAHQGRIHAANRLGGGACFKVSLPIGTPPELPALP